MHKYSSRHFGDIQISRDLDLPLKEDVISAWYYFGSKIRKSDYNKDICRIRVLYNCSIPFFSFLVRFYENSKSMLLSLMNYIEDGHDDEGTDLFHYNCRWILK